MTDSEIVRAVAENVLGLCGPWCDCETAPLDLGDGFCHDCEKRVMPNPLTSNHFACEVVDRMASGGWSYMIANGCQIPRKGSICCVFKKGDGRGDCYTEDRRRAICLSALKALGVDVQEGENA